MAEQTALLWTIVLMMLIDFKKVAVDFRNFFGLGSSQSFPVLTIAENKLCEADSSFMFNIIADKDWNYKDNIQAYYCHSTNSHEIGIRESVYNKARNGNKQALYSLAHEISHWTFFNYSGMEFNVKKYQQLAPSQKAAFTIISENIADLLTALFLCNEDELFNALGEADSEYSSCMSKAQISVALFYCKNYKILVNNFVKIFKSKFNNLNLKREDKRRASRQKNKPLFNYR